MRVKLEELTRAGFELEVAEKDHVVGYIDAETAQDAKARVTEALPPGDYTVDEPVQDA